MGKQFDVTELLRVAVADEKGGIEMYQKLAEKATDESLREMFLKLSEVEKIHCERFGKMIDDLAGEESEGVYPDEYVDYLEALSAGGNTDVFSQIDACQRDSELLGLAIRFERDQLSLQKDIGNILGDRHADIINEVIEEERSHLVQLARAGK